MFYECETHFSHVNSNTALIHNILYAKERNTSKGGISTRVETALASNDGNDNSVNENKIKTLPEPNFHCKYFESVNYDYQ